MSEFLVRFREWRSRYFHNVGGLLLSLGITANMMTTISVLSGLAAAYFLFSNTLLFVLFALLHLLADGVDGIIARMGKPTNFGRYFDYSADRMISFLLLIKIGWVISHFAYVVALLFLINNIIYITADFKAPVLFTRTILLLLLIVRLPTIAFIVVGAVSIYSLTKQVQWYYGRRGT
ncbi:MAG: CDP-alcohol phosphatidyltransferase family protein [Nanoarchaeota archaeon]|nr:CDP-alcohol phosphatidyltransferase family protein [Nanoarchaeota archaeon]